MATAKIQRSYTCGNCITEVDNVCCPDFCNTDAGVTPPMLVGICGYNGPCCPCVSGSTNQT